MSLPDCLVTLVCKRSRVHLQIFACSLPALVEYCLDFDLMLFPGLKILFSRLDRIATFYFFTWLQLSLLVMSVCLWCLSSLNSYTLCLNPVCFVCLVSAYCVFLTRADYRITELALQSKSAWFLPRLGPLDQNKAWLWGHKTQAGCGEYVLNMQTKKQ